MSKNIDNSQFRKAKLKELVLKLHAGGSQESVQWELVETLGTIPYGEVVSYKSIAEAIGNPKAARAVGGANGKNPIPIIVPCHRCIGSDGSLTGFGGGLETKKRLIDLERSSMSGPFSHGVS